MAERLRAVGVDADADEVETSALTTAAVLADRGVRRAFVVGEAGIVEALTDAGVEVVAGEPDVVDAVVVGWDRDADYTKLRVASVLVQRGAPLVATNPDASFPAADGTKWPGAGALLATIETTTGVRGEVIGKPYPPLLLAALERAGGGARCSSATASTPTSRVRRASAGTPSSSSRASPAPATWRGLRSARPTSPTTCGVCSPTVREPRRGRAEGGWRHPRGYADENNDDRERISR